MSTPAPALFFPSIRDLWATQRGVIEGRRVEGFGLPAAVMAATVVFVDAGDFTSLSNRHPGVPAVAGFAAHHIASLIENWAVGLLGGRVRGIYLDKIVGDAVLLVIPGAGPASIELGLRLASAVLTGPDMYRLHVGVHAGDTCLCDVGLPARINRTAAFEQVTVMGSVVNLAARLASVAAHGTVAVLSEPLTEHDLNALPLPNDLERLRLTPEVPSLRPLKGFRNRDVRVQDLRGRPVVSRDVIDIDEMLARVAEMGLGLPRVGDAS